MTFFKPMLFLTHCIGHDLFQARPVALELAPYVMSSLPVCCVYVKICKAPYACKAVFAKAQLTHTLCKVLYVMLQPGSLISDFQQHLVQRCAQGPQWFEGSWKRHRLAEDRLCLLASERLCVHLAKT